MSTWWEHAIDAFAAARRHSAQKAEAKAAEREARTAPKRMSFDSGPTTPTLPRPEKKTCCITQRKLKAPEGGGGQS